MNKGTATGVKESGLWTTGWPDLKVIEDISIVIIKDDKHNWLMLLNYSSIFLTCMDTCQGQEWGLAGSPFTMRDTTFGGMTGLPHVRGQSGKSLEDMVKNILCLAE